MSPFRLILIPNSSSRSHLVLFNHFLHLWRLQQDAKSFISLILFSSMNLVVCLLLTWFPILVSPVTCKASLTMSARIWVAIIWPYYAFLAVLYAPSWLSFMHLFLDNSCEELRHAHYAICRITDMMSLVEMDCKRMGSSHQDEVNELVEQRNHMHEDEARVLRSKFLVFSLQVQDKLSVISQHRDEIAEPSAGFPLCAFLAYGFSWKSIQPFLSDGFSASKYPAF